ncbi:hypothetical protein DFR68_12037 [Nocardia mexicana]|uniref:Uncharacterized protein n=2 Tax=Nocardia mexicana TaxID=279262 RepID=A0A370GJM3_9NOCA|nr:hypothetical protein DFR68_12037 [Nocardia mexicana]
MLTPADRQLVADQIARIDAGTSEHWLHLWPEHIDRPDLIARLHTYATLTETTGRYADYLAQNPGHPVPAMMVLLLDDTRRQHHELSQLIVHGRGLLDIERVLLATTVEHLSLGGALPELLLVDEQSKAAVDRARHHDRVETLCQAVDTQLTGDLARAGVPIDRGGERGRELTGIDRSLLDAQNAARDLAHTRRDPDHAHRRFDRAAHVMDQHLAQHNAAEPVRAHIDVLLTHLRDTAADLGHGRRARMNRWQDRLAAAVYHRDQHAGRHTIGAAIDPLLPDSTTQHREPDITGPDPQEPPPSPPNTPGPEP